MSTTRPKLLWCVMKAHGWENVECERGWLRPPPEGPHKFIPVFNTREQAVAWAGSDDHVQPLEVKQ